MVKRMAFLLLLAAAIVSLNMNTAHATPLAMYYEIQDLGGGSYDYEFTLTLDNNDDSWVSGQGWDWLIFGDILEASSPLTNFVGDSSDLPIGPWTSYTISGGGHNGPTLLNMPNFWVPASVGESLNWSGTSTAYLGQGDLLFSTLVHKNNAVPAYLEVAEFGGQQGPTVPEPATIILFGAGLVGTFFRKRK